MRPGDGLRRQLHKGPKRPECGESQEPEKAGSGDS
jgi:hypothetical protein